MISVDEARTLIGRYSSLLPAKDVPLADAARHILARDVIAPHDIPNYRQSSMDGFAFAWADAAGPLVVKTAIAAGDGEVHRLLPGEAARVFTGAPVPEGADTVIMQEKAELRDDRLYIPVSVVQQGEHLRPVGSDISKGAVAMSKGQLLTPTALAFLGAMGISIVSVIPFPRISLIITGNELIQPGDQPGLGKVFEASSFGLKAALQALGFFEIDETHVRDDLELLTSRLGDAINRSDLVLITGGVSVGDHDYTKLAAAGCGVQEVFHKVKQRPGKPLFFGKHKEVPVFGLPGNPSSVLTCFYQYVLLCMAMMTGRSLQLQNSKAVLQHDYRKTAALTHFLKAVCYQGLVTLSSAQESYKLSAFSDANCFVVVPDDKDFLPKGSEVQVHHLPSV